MCSRQMARVRCATRSWWRFARRRSTAEWSSSMTVCSFECRNATTAAARHVVRVGLVDSRSVEQSRSRRQRRWHIKHHLTDGDQLLRQQSTRAGRALDCPTPRHERCGERHQLVTLTAAGTNSDLADDLLMLVEHRCTVGSLVGIDSDHEHLNLLDDRPMERRSGQS